MNVSKKKIKVFLIRSSIFALVLLWCFSGAHSLLSPEIFKAEAAFSSITARGTNVTGSGNNGSVSVSPSANITAGKIAVVMVVSDSEQTTDGDSTLHSLADTDGNTWSKVFERTETDGADSDGATASMWWAYVATQIDTSDSITATFSANQADSTIAVFEVTVGAGKTVATTTTTPTQSASGTSLSHSLSSLTSREYMFVGFFGAEGEDTAKTSIANYSELVDLVSATAGAADANVQMHVGTRILTGTGDTWTSSAVTFTSGIQSLVAFYETDITTTLGDGTDPGNSTIAPGASATEIDRFSFATSAGTDTVTALTVTLAPANAYTNIATVDVQTTGGSSKCSATPSSNTVSLSSCAIAVTTSATEYKIMITPKSHANMAAPATGASYDTTATVTNWTGTNTHAGSDTDSATITVDNDSPNNVSSASVSAGDEENSLSWTNPGDGDFDNVIILQRAGSAVADTPTEGSTYATSSTIGSSTVVCSGLVTSCTSSSLSNGTAYHYKIFAKDSRGNWSDSGITPTGSPATPAGPTLTQAAYRLYTPSDGSSWTARSAAGNDDGWYGITYGNNIFVAVGDNAVDATVMTSQDGISWTARSAAGDNDSWRSVTYGNNIFVAVGASGDRVMTSSDGISWTAQSAAGNNDGWESVTYGNGLFVAVGSGTDYVMTSSDGASWTARSAAGDNDNWNMVTYNDGVFVAVGVSGDRVMTSEDGISWTAQSAAGNDDTWRGITYGDGLFVAVGESGDRVMTSPDGVNWTARSAVADDDSWKFVTYGNNLFVAVGASGDRVMTSSDGISWTAQSAAGNNDGWESVTYGNGLFVAVGVSGDRAMTSGAIGGDVLANQDAAGTLTSTGQVFRLRTRVSVDDSSSPIGKRQLKLQYAQKSGTCDTSFSGETYADVSESTPIAFFDDVNTTSTTTPASGNEVTNAGRDLLYQTYEEANNFTNSVFAIPTGDDGLWDFSLYDNGMSGAYCLRLVNSTDSQSWTERSAAGDNDSWFGVTYGNNTFVAVGGSGDRVMTSSNGTDWTARSAAEDDDDWRDVAYGNNTFAAVAFSGDDRVMTSSDGATWTPVSAAGDDDQWLSVTYGNNLFVAVGTGADRVMTSSDGSTWTVRSAAGDNDQWLDVEYGNGLYVAVGGSGDRVMTSPDGITWTVRSAAGDDDSWGSVFYADGTWVAVGDSISGDKTMTSPDGITWTVRSNSGGLWDSVTNGNGLFVAISPTGSPISTSPDGIAWKVRSAAGDNDTWNWVTYGSNLFLAVGSSDDRVITAPTSATVLDSYAVVPEVSSAAAAPAVHQVHYRWRKDNVSEASTSFTAAEDTQLNTSSVQVGDRIRLRVLLSNTGQGEATNYKHKLEYSSGACSAWSTIPNDSDSDPWRMSLSTRVTDDDATADNTGLTNPGGLSFVAGVVKSASSTTSAHTLAASQFTELEYVIRSTLNAVAGTTYCFKVTNEGSTTNYTYDVTPSLVLPANAVRPQSGGSSSAVESPAPPSTPVTGGDEGGSDGGTGEGGGGGAPAGGGNEGGGGGGDLGQIKRNLASILNNIQSLLLRIR